MWHSSSTGDQDSYSYDDADQLTGVQMTQGTSTLASIADTLDPAGLISNQTQTGLPGAASIDYSYSADEQLQSAGSLDYAYDQADNATELDGQTGYSYDAASELTSSPTASYSYDQLGERTTATPADDSGATTYGYDQAGDLTAVTPPSGTGSSYTYDGAGELATATTGTSTNSYAWDQVAATPLLLTDGHTSYIYGPGGLAIEQIAADGTTTYLHHDQIGSTRLITDASGNTVATITYNPYGQVSASTGSASTNLGYAGEYTDPDTGLEYDQARWYDPTTGQFLSVDPLEQQTQQAYAYASDNPLSYTDPSGLDDVPLGERGAAAFASYCQQTPRPSLCDYGAGALNSIGNWISAHPLEAVALLAGTASFATGIGEVAAAAGFLGADATGAAGALGSVSAASGLVSTLSDLWLCTRDHKAIACVGAVTGAVGAGAAFVSRARNLREPLEQGLKAIGIPAGALGSLGDAGGAINDPGSPNNSPSSTRTSSIPCRS